MSGSREEARVPRRRLARGIPVEFLVCILCCLSVLSLTWFLGSRDPHQGTFVRHPMVSDVARKAVSLKRNSNVRYLSFGEHHAWGNSLDDYHDAYPWQLSDNVKSAAMLVGGLALSAVCTESIVGNESFDVIMLQYFLHAEEGLRALSMRLRERFPNALIVFVRLWDPTSFIFHITDDRNQRESLIEFANRNGFESFLHADFLKTVVESDPKTWQYIHYQTQAGALQEIANSVGGVVYTMPLPETPVEALTKYMDWFNPHNAHSLSKMGHDIVTTCVQQIVDDEKILSKSIAVRNQLGTWGGGDLCNMWYSTGKPPNVPHSMHLEYNKLASSLHSNNFKYVLEIPPQGGTITINNPFDVPRTLHLTYMTSSLPVMTFPTTKIMLGALPGIVINPINNLGQLADQSPQTSVVGKISPGLTIVGFQPAQFGTEGFGLLAGDDVPVVHSLENESVYLNRSRSGL